MRSNSQIISIYKLEEGMRLAADICLRDGAVLLKKDTELTEKNILKLKNYPIDEVKIISEYVNINNDDLFIQNSYIERLKETSEFKVFNKTYKKSIGNIKQSINDIIIKNEDINVDALVNNVYKVLNLSSNSLNMFDMLHCMRDYDDLTFVHSFNVSLICNMIGKWLKLSEEDNKKLILAGLLHDIGKIKVDTEIVTKPGKLTDDEFYEMKKHAQYGYYLVKNMNIDQNIKKAILMHHEKCDGSGYPLGLKESQIEPIAKIVAIADVYDAMTADRVYRKAMCPFDVLEIFQKEGFEKYDLKYLLPFLEHVAYCYINQRVRLSDERVGTIVMVNKKILSKPLIRIGDEFIDLSKVHNLKIVEMI